LVARGDAGLHQSLGAVKFNLTQSKVSAGSF
jgi:hypothetical protein